MSGVDVLAVLDSAESVLRSNMRRCNNKASRGEPHRDSLIKQQRAAYLLEHYAAARAAVAELLEALERLVDAHDEWRGEDRPDPKTAMRQARAAIAKATGGPA